MSDTRNNEARKALLCWSLALCACGGSFSTPGEDEVLGNAGRGGRGGSSGAAGRGGSSPVRPEVRDAGIGGSSGSAGTSGSNEDPPDAGRPIVEERVYCDAYTDVFRVSCGPSCHQNVGVPIGDFGVNPEDHLKYINRVSVRDPACGLIINPNEPLESLILTKVTGDFARGDDVNCGAQMPVGSLEITQAQINCLADWVLQFGE